ncbi:hypothetical protein CLV28_2217 [Sediminihabitans luteus]|uniref:Glycosyltransferase A (GT-A) superfamily protein (DUF2064 family) n=1 Tax=Sediminihabitans luteus TaxID=1138585 RepID=A0A2M9CEU5_9CELL|nr:DUF2064 domain-containing protein [Sediminihabitans luteus]PJJ70382.1 hypothetical protein CLV28_2217 [Sediminihabitans luteus]GII97854.1 glycosyl transferase [Sediminihabitans luteus]
MSAREPARTVVVLAKEPVAGRSKTRLHAEFTPEQAADLARAALEDTFDAVLAVPDVARVLVLDGDPGTWVPSGFDVLHQVTGGLDRRLAAAFAATAEEHEGPILLVGMDTPQLAARGEGGHGLDLGAVDLTGADAVLGLADDGGFWAIGLPRGDRHFYDSVFHGIPMSTDTTGQAQLDRLREFGLRVTLLPTLRDVDLPDDARAVAHAAPGTRFATAWATATGEPAPTASAARHRADDAADDLAAGDLGAAAPSEEPDA